MSAAILTERVKAALGAQVVSIAERAGEVTLVVAASGLIGALTTLRDHPELRFEQLIDLAGVDYQGYAGAIDNNEDGKTPALRFAVVYHLLSITHNRRLRVRVFATDDDFPVLESAIPVWPAANWYEREAFDLFGIVFTGHPDLRRLLTDYGFIGHPFRKDFPISGNVEMRYDAEQGRVIYQPVSIEPREIVPRIVREEHYADTESAGFRKG